MKAGFKRNILLLVIGLCLKGFVFAQAPSDKAMIAHADILFQARKYEEAYPYYLKLKDVHADVVLYSFRAGVCAIYASDPDQALTLIKSAYDKDPNIQDLNFFLGRAYLLNDQYDDASLQFNLQLAKETDPILKERLNQYVVNCQAAKEIASKPTNNKVENGGRPLNSPGDEYAPILTKNDSVLIFTYKGQEVTGGKHYTFGHSDSAGYYFEDIFQTYLTRGGWFAPQGISDHLNSPAHDAASALSPDGQTMFLFRSSAEDGGDIYYSHRMGYDWSKPVKMAGDVNKPDSWEGSVTISRDGHTIFFSSDRAGGFGGKDLYKATLIGDSTWGNVQNLGSNVNTPLDDDAPFLIDDGSMLYYSSRGHNSMGGYDIFFSTRGGDMLSWELAQNIGAPINSTADDIYYQPTKDGAHAVFASNRKGGNGMMDIYFADPGVAAKEMVTITGTVTLDGNPIGAMVTVAYNNKGDVQGDYSASTENGKYSINLPAGEDYKLYFQVTDQEEYTRTFDASAIKSYTTHVIDVEFHSDTSRTKGDMIDPGKGIKMRRDSSANFLNEDGSPVDPGYYVIIGSFKNKDFAKRLQQKEQANGVYSKVQIIFNKKSGFTYVTVSHPVNQDEAVNVVKKTRKAYADAWIQFLK